MGVGEDSGSLSALVPQALFAQAIPVVKVWLVQKRGFSRKQGQYSPSGKRPKMGALALE
jgi:hypothetical protein